MRHKSKCPACVLEALEVLGESPANPGHSEISEYVPKLTVLQLSMENWFCIFRSFFCPNLEKNVSTLIFCHEKLIMRTFFTHVAVTDQNWFYFFTPSILRIAHSGTAGPITQRCDVLLGYLVKFSDFIITNVKIV